MYFLKLWESVRLFASMAYVNPVFLPPKTEANETLPLDTRGSNAAFTR